LRVLNSDGKYSLHAFSPQSGVTGFLRLASRLSPISSMRIPWCGAIRSAPSIAVRCCVSFAETPQTSADSDEAFFYHYEEVISARVWNAGHPIFHPRTMITHLGGQSVSLFLSAFEIESTQPLSLLLQAFWARARRCRRLSSHRFECANRYGLLNLLKPRKFFSVGWRCTAKLFDGKKRLY